MNALAPANYPLTSSNRETQLRQRITSLEMQRDRLADEVADLRATFGLHSDPGLKVLGFSDQQATVLSVLLKREMATHEQLRFALWPNDANARAERDEKYTHVMACKIRQRLMEFGLHLHLVWGKGYRIPEADKAKLREIIAAAK